MKMVKFRKLYERTAEGELVNAIIAHTSHLYRTRIEVRDKVGRVHVYSTKVAVREYKHILLIDLWICQLRLTWRSDHENA
jgi:hypothetical protein